MNKVVSKIVLKNILTTILLVFGLLNLGLVSASQTCSENPIVINGCTDKGLIPGGFKKLFDSDCNNHDICYYQLGKTKGDCDRELIGKLNVVCHNNFGRRIFAHGDPEFIGCDQTVNVMRNVLSESNISRNGYADNQKSTWSYLDNLYAASRATACDNKTPRFASSEAAIFNGSFGQQFQVLLKRYGRTLTQLEFYNAKRHYYKQGGGDATRLRCSSTIKTTGYPGCYPSYLQSFIPTSSFICSEELFLTELKDWEALPNEYQNCIDPSWQAILYRDLVADRLVIN